MSVNPWDVNPDLSEERLNRLAALFREVRATAYSTFDYWAGQSKWSLGCDVYARARFAIRLRAHDRDLDAIAAGAPMDVDGSLVGPPPGFVVPDAWAWLSVANPHMDFMFRIGRTTLRFYTGSPDKPKSNLLQLSLFEENPANRDYRDSVWRVSIETDERGSEVLTVSLVLVGRDGQVHHKWELDPDAGLTSFKAHSAPLMQTDTLPAPELRLRPLLDQNPPREASDASGGVELGAVVLGLEAPATTLPPPEPKLPDGASQMNDDGGGVTPHAEGDV